MLVALAACGRPAAPAASVTAELGALGAPGLRAMSSGRLEETTRYLSSDDLAGRAPGTPGGARAEDYVAESFGRIGLEPLGEGKSYFQTVPLREARLAPEGSALVLRAGGVETSLVPGEGALLRPFPRAADVGVDAPLVFAGFGISRPDLGYDDLAGVDVRGAIAVVYGGAPRAIGGRELSSTLHAVLSDGGARGRVLQRHGARALIVVWDPIRAQKTAFASFAKGVPAATMAWLDHGEPGSAPALPTAVADEAALERALGAAADAHPLHDLWTAIDRGEPRRASLGATAALRLRSSLKDITARNVIGLYRGGDPALRADAVVYSAHVDHLGIGAPVDGDAIYNGALDDAIGVAGMLEIARAFAALPARPARSVLFLADTAEESGLLGSDYFASHPTLPIERCVADINIDSLTPNYEAFDVVPLGADHSTLAAHVAAAARASGYSLSADPEPSEAYFIRSDQYSFVKRGVPSLFPGVGYRDARGETAANRAISDAWAAQNYHRPSDVWRPEYHAEWATREAGFDFLLGLSVAIAKERPTWNAGDVFARAAP